MGQVHFLRRNPGLTDDVHLGFAVGDLAINESTGAQWVLQSEGGGWIQLPGGGAGATGATGPTGDTGGTGATGATGAPGSGLLQKAGPVTVSSADILAGTTTPITIVPTPGPNKVNIVVRSFYNPVQGGILYSGGGDWGLFYGSKTGALADSGDWSLNTDANGVGWNGFNSIIMDLPNPNSRWTDQPIVYTGITPLTAGNGTMKITVFYVTVDVT
jgi:hypothetical protein